MIRSTHNKFAINDSFFIYISMFFLLWPDINLGENSFFSNKPLSIWICLIYIVLNIKMLLKKIKKNELLFASMLLLLVITGCILSIGENGILRQINGYIGVFITYFAIKIYCIKSSPTKLLKLLKTMFISYLLIILIIGGLQVIYIYLGHNEFIEYIFRNILWRGYQYFVGVGRGRLSFTFSEPSLAGFYFYCFFIPAYLLCKKYRIFTEIFLRRSLIICFLMNMLTLSGRWAIDTVVCLGIVLIRTLRKGKISKKQFFKWSSIIISVGLILIIVCAFLLREQFGIYAQRFINIFSNYSVSSADADQSIIVRLSLINVAMIAFLHSPLFGVGMGNFYIAFNKYIVMPANELARAELMGCRHFPQLTSYSFYFTSISEGGIIGIALIGVIISVLRKPHIKEFRILSWFIIYIFLQNEFYGSPVIAIWLAIINSGCFLVKESINEDIDYYTVSKQRKDNRKNDSVRCKSV